MARQDRLTGFHVGPDAGHIIRVLRRNGYKALSAGGCVRDYLMGRGFSDVDILTDAPVDAVFDLFQAENTKKVGKTFHLCLVNGIEVASARDDNRSGSSSKFPANDLEKRDLTINSMACDPVTGGLFDPFGGRDDLENRIIRFTRDPAQRIAEDPLRLLRAQRLASQIDHAVIEPASFAAIQTHGEFFINNTAPERIRMEILKAMGHRQPSGFFRTLHDTGTLALVLPSLERCHGLDGGPHHGETVFDHCMIAGDAVSPKFPLLRLAGYLHDTGKFDAAVVKDGNLSFAGHENETGAVVKDLETLRFSRDETGYIVSVIRVHMRPLTGETTPKSARKLLAFLQSHGIGWRDFMRLRIADKKGNLAKRPYTLSEIKTRAGRLSDELDGDRKKGFSVDDLNITGHDIMGILNLKQGPEIGRVKEWLFEKVLADPALNSRTRLEKLTRDFYRGVFAGLSLAAAVHSIPLPL